MKSKDVKEILYWILVGVLAFMALYVMSMPHEEDHNFYWPSNTVISSEKRG